MKYLIGHFFNSTLLNFDLAVSVDYQSTRGEIQHCFVRARQPFLTKHTTPCTCILPLQGFPMVLEFFKLSWECEAGSEREIDEVNSQGRTGNIMQMGHFIGTYHLVFFYLLLAILFNLTIFLHSELNCSIFTPSPL